MRFQVERGELCTARARPGGVLPARRGDNVIRAAGYIPIHAYIHICSRMHLPYGSHPTRADNTSANAALAAAGNTECISIAPAKSRELYGVVSVPM